MSLPLPLLLLLLLLLSPLVHADFELDDTDDGPFRIRLGNTGTCPSRLDLTNEGRTHPAPTIFLDGIRCTGGTLILNRNPTGQSTLLNFLARNSQAGDYYAGSLTGDLRCGRGVLSRNTLITIFKPDDSFISLWVNVLGRPGGRESAVESASRVDVWRFDDDNTFVFIDSRCMLQRDDDICLPASARIHTETGPRRVDQIHTGELVAVGKGEMSRVFAWTHRDARAHVRAFVTIRLEDGHEVTVTEGHFVYANGVAVAAKRVSVGDFMEVMDGGKVRVVGIEKGVRKKGLYNPQTLHGDLVVDGVKVTTYTTAVRGVTAHALLAPWRGLFRVALLWRVASG